MNAVTLSVVQDLIGISEARRIGYEKALSQTNNPELIENFKKSIVQSKVFIDTMSPYIQKKEQFEITQQVVTPVYNDWRKVGSVKQNTLSGIVDSCLNAEITTVKAFESSLKETLPSHIQKIIGNELLEIDSKMKYLQEFKFQ